MTFDQFLRIAQICVGVGVVIIGAWVRSVLGRVTDRLARVEERTDRTERRLTTLKEQRGADAIALASQTVSREDYIRESARFRQTLERLVEGQSRLEGRLDVGTRIAAGIERLADRPERKAED